MVDWTQPLEAVHRDGRSWPVEFDRWTDSGFVLIKRPPQSDCAYGFMPSGEGYRPGCDYHIRNRQPTPSTEPSAELVARMVALVHSVKNTQPPLTIGWFETVQDEARAIVAELPAPVDADRVLAEQIISDAGNGLIPYETRVAKVLAALRGRGLEREGK